MTNKEMANYFNVDINVIRRKLQELNLRRYKKFIPLDDEISIHMNREIGNYMITNHGNIYNNTDNHLIAPQLKRGYLSVGLTDNKITKWRLVHRLLALYFIPNNTGLDFDDLQVNHIDGNKLNNSLSNLEWVTPSENQIHAYENNLKIAKKGSESNFAKITEEQAHMICKCIESGMKNKDIINKYDFAAKSIVEKIKSKKRWVHITKDYKF